MTPSVCGSFLDDCRCKFTQTDDPRPWREIEARHREAVRRAARADSRGPSLVPAEAVEHEQRRSERQRRAA